MVRFQVNVQFCLQECLPVNCDNSRHVDSELLKTTNSWGKRRRRRDASGGVEGQSAFMANQTELHREIIVESSSQRNVADKLRGSLITFFFVCVHKLTN